MVISTQPNLHSTLIKYKVAKALNTTPAYLNLHSTLIKYKGMR